MPLVFTFPTIVGPPNPILKSSTPLLANATWASDPIATGGWEWIVGSIFADQPGTIYIEQSNDKTNWDISTQYSISANDGKGYKEAALLPWARVRYVNGPNAQSEFRINVGLRD